MPGGRISQDQQFKYKYDKEGNLVERAAKFQPVTIDDKDTSNVILASGYGFSTETGVYPASAPEQQYGGGGLNNVSAQVKFGEGTQLESGEYDLWITWKPRNDLGTGKITLQVQDDFTRANPDSVFNSNVIGNATWGWGMVRDGATGTYVRTSDPQKVDTIPIAFLVAPKYLHDDGLRWFHVGTIHLEAASTGTQHVRWCFNRLSRRGDCRQGARGHSTFAGVLIASVGGAIASFPAARSASPWVP